MKRLYLSILIFFACGCLHAQQFGGFPPSVKWKQINTDTARVIFPAAVDSQAQQIAAIIHKIITERPNSLGSTVRKINIVLHNNTTLANGYVALAPFRSEYYLVPGSDIFEFGANPWYQELAVHEFRHVLQFSNFNRGISKLGSVLFGQEGQALFNALAIPDWFWEGDAVHAETSLTPQGRGRTPFFYNGFKALWRDGRDYSWMKLRNGSLKDYVPNHYELGYLLVNYGYLKYGNDFWGRVTSDAAAFEGGFYPWQHAMKKYTGVDYKTFRKQALAYYRDKMPKKEFDTIKRQTVTNYFYPQYIGNDSLLYAKSSYQSLPAFYIQDRDGEHKLRLRNITTEDWFSYRNGWIAYTGYEPDARWDLRDYSSIYRYNIRTGEQEKITAKEKYYTPDIAPSGDKLVAVWINEKVETELHVLDKKGHVLKRIKPADHSYFNQPRFIDDNSVMVIERLPNSTMQMSRIDLTTGTEEVLIPSTAALIGYPFVKDNQVYFVSSLQGNDDIYALRLSDKKIFKVEEGVTGKYYPSVYKDTLVWSSFTSNGLRWNQKEMTTRKSDEQINSGQWKEVQWPFPVANATASSNILTEVSRQFPVSDYRQGNHLFNFHSWRPDYTDPEFTLSLFSDNMLNTFSNEIYYRYNQNETSNTVGFSSSYGRLFPVINAGVEYTLGRTIRDTSSSQNLNQLEARIGYNIPLNFSGGRMYRFLNFGSSYVFNQTSLAGGKDSARTHYQYLRHFISWAHYLPMARQQIYPKFGYTVSVNLRHIIADHFSKKLSDNAQWLFNAQLFLPSIKNHSIVFTGSYQRVDTISTVFSNLFSNSRGYDDLYFRTAWRISGNYHFPIAYPDFGVANIVYLLRLRGNIFYDFTKVYGGYFARDAFPLRNLRSTGLEIYFDTKWWNELPVSFGVRVSHLLDNGFTAADKRGNTWFEFIVPVNLKPD
jgi:hypothetical protein